MRQRAHCGLSLLSIITTYINYYGNHMSDDDTNYYDNHMLCNLHLAVYLRITLVSKEIRVSNIRSVS